MFFDFFANNIEKKNLLARGKNFFQTTFLLKKSYFCVLQPLLGETTKKSKIDHFQVTLPTMAVAPMTMPPNYPAIHPPSIPDRSSSLPMEELIRRNESQREEQTNSAIRNALNSDERRANSLIQGALQGN